MESLQCYLYQETARQMDNDLGVRHYTKAPGITYFERFYEKAGENLGACTHKEEYETNYEAV